ncbi:nuclear transport factor 2 family protein [Sulfuriferula thiophila]|uniref:nuclear transport factor 2 family protein n=1 Tax=Sulfuriferula thiophila TaxID=1781211 RepID=UPI000F608852|nr:nuclear transport factor 2 family protein [Sulfuriferula thiophila]
MKKLALFLLMFLVTVSGDTVLAAQISDQKTSVPTVTRLVQIFGSLEHDLGDNAKNGNIDAVGKMLMDDFEMRVGAMPGNPVPRAQWLQQIIQRPGFLADIQQMAVHDYDSVAVVSFLLKQDKSAKTSADIYMVDVWKKVGDKWLLAVRYASPAGSSRFAIPGLAADMPQLDKRY